MRVISREQRNAVSTVVVSTMDARRNFSRVYNGGLAVEPPAGPKGRATDQGVGERGKAPLKLKVLRACGT